MKVQTSKGEHKLRWEYGTCDKQVPNGRDAEGNKKFLSVKQDCTSCVITDDKGEEVARITNTRYFKDPENKPLVRKQTFETAISGFNKSDRRAFWDVFTAHVKRDADDKRFRAPKKHEDQSKEAA